MRIQMKEKKVLNKKLLIGIIVLAILAGVLGIIYSTFGAKPEEGTKNITIEVIGKEQSAILYDVKTDAEYLREAMEEAKGLTFEVEDGMVNTINGETAIYEVDGAYWSFYVNDEYCNYGIDTQPVIDGDKFLIEYTNSVVE